MFLLQVKYMNSLVQTEMREVLKESSTSKLAYKRTMRRIIDLQSLQNNCKQQNIDYSFHDKHLS